MDKIFFGICEVIVFKELVENGSVKNMFDFIVNLIVKEVIFGVLGFLDFLLVVNVDVFVKMIEKCVDVEWFSEFKYLDWLI